MNVSLVLVSHSARLAEGLAELAGQMAPDVDIRPVGGVDGGLGTDFDAVLAAFSGEGAAVVLYDLGSARMIAELAIEALAEPERVALVEAPFVEGTVAAAVAAQSGASLAQVVAATHGVNMSAEPRDAAVTEPADARTANQQSADVYQAKDEARRSAAVPNELGLHARPAAALARAAAKLETAVTVRKGERTAAAASVLELLGLDVRQGDTLELTAQGEHAEHALAQLATLIESGLGDSL